MIVNKFKVVLQEEEVKYKADGRRSYANPYAISEFVESELKIRQLADEYVFCICLDNHCHIMGVFEVSHGSATETLLPIREIFQKALLIGAARIVLVHNHPSGSLEPSRKDLESTQNVKKASEIIGVKLLDHLIFSSFGGYYSMKEENCIDI